MCFYITDTIVRTATEDVVCYKILIKTNENTYFTPYQGMKVKLGERYDVEEGDVGGKDIFALQLNRTDVTVHGGAFHSYKYKKAAFFNLMESPDLCNRNCSLALVEAIIPKDTKYMVNDSEYVSKSIIYTQELQEKKPEDAEGHVSFETCKLLKEKGFDWPCMFYYRGDNPYDFNKTYYKQNYNDTTHFLSRPTLSAARKYLLEKFDLFLAIDIVPYSKEQSYYFYRVYRKREPLTNHYPTDFYNTPEEAENAAIVYCLTNLV